MPHPSATPAIDPFTLLFAFRVHPQNFQQQQQPNSLKIDPTDVTSGPKIVSAYYKSKNRSSSHPAAAAITATIFSPEVKWRQEVNTRVRGATWTSSCWRRDKTSPRSRVVGSTGDRSPRTSADIRS